MMDLYVGVRLLGLSGLATRTIRCSPNLFHLLTSATTAANIAKSTALFDAY
ncbi:hypothetical protein Plhal304r1_c017g0062281 [Plasmopara halstedii]